jgi:hypothetical protein
MEDLLLREKKNNIMHRETFDTYEDPEKWIETFK